MWSWGGFRMILNREHRMVQTSHPFNCIIVQTEMADRHRAVLGLHDRPVPRGCMAHTWHLDCEVVVLRSDLHLPRPQVHHRVIGPMVAELQFVGVEPHGQPENLMSQANAEDGSPPDQSTNRFDRVWDPFRIPWTVREDDAVRLDR